MRPGGSLSARKRLVCAFRSSPRIPRAVQGATSAKMLLARPFPSDGMITHATVAPRFRSASKHTKQEKRAKTRRFLSDCSKKACVFVQIRPIFCQQPAGCSLFRRMKKRAISMAISRRFTWNITRTLKISQNSKIFTFTFPSEIAANGGLALIRTGNATLARFDPVREFLHRSAPLPSQMRALSWGRESADKAG